MSAKTKIRYEISELNESLKKAKEEIAKFKDEIGKLEGGGEYADLQQKKKQNKIKITRKCSNGTQWEL